MKPHLDIGIAKRIVQSVTAIPIQQIDLIGQGATSIAWRVQCDGEQLIVRAMPRGQNRPVTYQSEFTLLQLLRAQGHPVPEPVRNYADDYADPLADLEPTRKMIHEAHEAHEEQSKLRVPSSPSWTICDFSDRHLAIPWAVTRVIPGQAIRRNALSISVAKRLGQLLADLHMLPCRGYGRLIEARAELIGLQENTLDGIRARWCWGMLWPYDGSDLHQHPITEMMPEFIDKITHLAPALWEIAHDDRVAIIHADLHGEHIFHANGRLTGVIDFGAAAIAVPAWEFAVLAHYHGWAAVEMVLDGYTTKRAERERILNQAQKLAIVVGLYKLARAVKATAKAGKVCRIMQFVSETVSVNKLL